MHIEIDRDILNEAKDVVENGLISYLSENTVNIETVIFILEAITRAVKDAENQLDNI